MTAIEPQLMNNHIGDRNACSIASAIMLTVALGAYSLDRPETDKNALKIDFMQQAVRQQIQDQAYAEIEAAVPGLINSGTATKNFQVSATVDLKAAEVTAMQNLQVRENNGATVSKFLMVVSFTLGVAGICTGVYAASSHLLSKNIHKRLSVPSMPE